MAQNRKTNPLFEKSAMTGKHEIRILKKTKQPVKTSRDFMVLTGSIFQLRIQNRKTSLKKCLKSGYRKQN